MRSLCPFLCCALLVLGAHWAAAAAPPAPPQANLDPGRWYRLTNTFVGEDRALEADSPEKSVPYMGRARDSAGQLWQLHPVKGGWHRITNQRLGEGWSLSADPEDASALRMVPTGESSRQRWRIAPLVDGYWRLTNQDLGNTQALDTYGDGDNAPFMGETGEYSGQLWKLSPAGLVAPAGSASPSSRTSPPVQAGAAATVPPKPTDPSGAATQAYRQQQHLGQTALAKPPVADPGAFPPPIRTFSFAPAGQKILPGTSAQKNAAAAGCDGIVHDADQIGNLALLSQFYQDDCDTDGQYNHADYKVERGTFKSSDGGIAAEAYRVYGPARQASEFLGSNHVLAFRIAAAGDYILYGFDGSTMAEVTRIASSQVVPGGYTVLDSVPVSELADPRVFFLWPAAQPLSAYHQVAPGVQGATLGQSAAGTVAKYLFQVQGTPFDTCTGFPYGPASHANVYSQCRQFFPLDLGPQIGVVWQDKETNAVNLTRLHADLKGQTTSQVTLKPGMRLAAAATDQEAIYLLLVQDGGYEDQQSKAVVLQKADLTGKVVLEKTHRSGAAGLNLTEFGEQNVGSMVVRKGEIGLVLCRRMHHSEDGLNHQGAIAVIFSAADLALLHNLGQTTSHSFDGYLTTSSSGDFLGADLGDAAPRGVNLYRFSTGGLKTQVVYTYKTKKGDTDAEKDENLMNNTFSELGAVVERADGYLVFFVGEPDPRGRSLDNSRTGENLVDPRNVGFVKVKKDFSGDWEWDTWNVVPSELMLSAGPAEEGGFLYSGVRVPQRNAGVNWITSYRDPKTENASRLRAAPLSADSVLLLWEMWDPELYRTTYALRVDASGQALTPPVELGSEVRLGRRDELLVRAGAVYLVMGNAREKKVEVVVLRP